MSREWKPRFFRLEKVGHINGNRKIELASRSPCKFPQPVQPESIRAQVRCLRHLDDWDYA